MNVHIFVAFTNTQICKCDDYSILSHDYGIYVTTWCVKRSRWMRVNTRKCCTAYNYVVHTVDMLL